MEGVIPAEWELSTIVNCHKEKGYASNSEEGTQESYSEVHKTIDGLWWDEVFFRAIMWN